MLRDLAECDCHYDAETVGKWTPYQFRMYTCDRRILTGKRSHASLEAAVAAAAESKGKFLRRFKQEEEDERAR